MRRFLPGYTWFSYVICIWDKILIFPLISASPFVHLLLWLVFSGQNHSQIISCTWTWHRNLYPECHHVGFRNIGGTTTVLSICGSCLPLQLNLSSEEAQTPWSWSLQEAYQLLLGAPSLHRGRKARHSRVWWRKKKSVNIYWTFSTCSTQRRHKERTKQSSPVPFLQSIARTKLTRGQ